MVDRFEQGPEYPRSLYICYIRIPVNNEEITISLIFFVMIDLGSFAEELWTTVYLDDGKYDFPIVQA